MANLYNVPLENSVQLTLQNSLTAGDTSTITFTSSVATKLQASSSMKGILIIDRIDSSGTETPTKTEIIAFTGVSGSTVTGLTRGLSGTTDQDHGVSAIVEFMPDITWAQAINDVFNEQHNPDGTHKTLSLLSLVSVTVIGATLSNPIINSSSLASVNVTNGIINNTLINNTSLASITTVNRAYIPVEQKFISSVATTTFDWSYSNIHSITLSSATTTLAFANPIAGQALITRLGQDGTGTRLVVFPSTIKWTGGTTPTLTTTASKTDVFGFLCTASGFYDGYIVGQNL